MSAQPEHTAEEADAESHAGDRSNEQSKSESSMLNNQTGMGMLEDEEMPTYISVSSPSRRDETDTNSAKQQDRPTMEEDHSQSPSPSDDQGGGSVYVLSSEEESNHVPYSDDEEDEFRDSEDMDDEEEEEEEEDEDEDDDTHLRLPPDDEDEFDLDYEPECNDRASDDFLLHNRLKKQHKEKSLSLQDLSICKDDIPAHFSRKRHSLNVLRENHVDSEQNQDPYPVMRKKPTGLFRNHFVKSKVKMYIQNIKEQSRKSLERRLKDNAHSNHNYQECNLPEQPKAAQVTKIKDYAEKVLKDLQSEENIQDENKMCNTNRVVENGKEMNSRNTETDGENLMDVDIYCAIVENDKLGSDTDNKLDKQNGPIDANDSNIPHGNSIERNLKLGNTNDACTINGHQPGATVLNLHALSYDEYMHGISNNRPSIEKNNKMNILNNTETVSSSKMNNAKNVQIEERKHTADIPNVTRASQTNNSALENEEIMNLKAQLRQKTAEFDSLLTVCEKTLAENLRMKQELEMLKNSMAKQEIENKSRETKIASVQTENLIESIVKEEVIEEIKEANKISTSSVASTISSIEQWADSACSPAISIKPPDLTALQSDDSMVLANGTPRKPTRPLSRAFITSSRILQTLSSIAQAKTNSPLAKISAKRIGETSIESDFIQDCNSPIQASSSKKRKATDTLGPSTFSQPFKIPHTSSESRRRRISSTNDGELKYAEENVAHKFEEQTNLTANTNSKATNSVPSDSAAQDSEDPDGNVKCFVYREDESSEDHSFLIQADGVAEDQQANEKGRIRECGPYLLGNVEVRMSEVNGTISIWGKEISQESTVENEETVEKSPKAAEKKACHCWQKTPQLRLNGSPFMCSTSKKSKISTRLSTHNTSQCSHAASSKSLYHGDDDDEHIHENGSCSPNALLSPCEVIDAATQRRGYSTCKRLSNSHEKIHSCCAQHAETSEKECGCNVYQSRPKYTEAFNCSKNKFNLKYNRRSSCRNTPDRTSHVHENLINPASEDVEITCKHNTYRCSTHSSHDGCQQHVKCCSSIRDVPHMCKLSSVHSNGHDNTERYSCNHSPSYDGDEDPLIPTKQSHETSELRQRRLRGKKVRGIIMDLFRGCGDCRNNSVNEVKNSKRKEPSYFSHNVPEIKVSPCDIAEASCSNSSQMGGRCCRAYARHIESQLEEFRMAMEKVRLRSDAILDMLSMLHSVDMN